MKGFFATASLEIARRRSVLVAAAIAAAGAFLAPLLKAPRSHSAADIRLMAAAFLAVTVAAALSLMLGATAIGSELSGRRLGFYFSRPIGGGAIWAGKLAASWVLVLLVSAIVLLPAVLSDVTAWKQMTGPWFGTAAAAFAGSILVLLAFGSLAGIAILSRSAWVAAELLALAVWAGLISVIAFPLFAAGAPLLLRGLALAAAAAGAAAVLAARAAQGGVGGGRRAGGRGRAGRVRPDRFRPRKSGACRDALVAPSGHRRAVARQRPPGSLRLAGRPALSGRWSSRPEWKLDRDRRRRSGTRGPARVASLRRGFETLRSGGHGRPRPGCLLGGRIGGRVDRADDGLAGRAAGDLDVPVIRTGAGESPDAGIRADLESRDLAGRVANRGHRRRRDRDPRNPFGTVSRGGSDSRRAVLAGGRPWSLPGPALPAALPRRQIPRRRAARAPTRSSRGGGPRQVTCC